MKRALAVKMRKCETPEDFVDAVFGPPRKVPGRAVQAEDPDEPTGDITEESAEEQDVQSVDTAPATDINLLPVVPPHELEWSVLRKQMESQFRANIADDDPLEMMAYLFYLTNRGMYLECAGAIKKHLDSQLTGFRQALDQASEQKRDETRREVMELMLTLRLQMREEKETLSKELASSTKEWQDSIEEVKVLAEQIVTTKQGNRWLTAFVGMLLAAGMLLAGILLGRMAR